MPVFERNSGAISFGHSGRRSWFGGYPWGFPYVSPTYVYSSPVLPYSSFPSNPTAQWYLSALGMSCDAWRSMDPALRTGAVVQLYNRYGVRLDPNSGIDGPRIQQIVDTVTSCAAYGDAGPATYISPAVSYGYPFGWGGWTRPWGFPLSPFGLGGFSVKSSTAPKPSGAIAILDSVSPMAAWIAGAVVGGAATYMVVKKSKK